jgi:hypothetical protein
MSGERGERTFQSLVLRLLRVERGRVVIHALLLVPGFADGSFVADFGHFPSSSDPQRSAVW